MNPIKGEAVLALGDGRRFTLVLDFEALIAAEAAYGKPLAMLMADAKAGFIGAVRALLIGALDRHHPDMGPADASAILQSDMDAVGTAMEAAVDAAFPNETGGEDRESGKARPDGKSYGANGARQGSPRKASGGRRRAASR